MTHPHLNNGYYCDCDDIVGAILRVVKDYKNSCMCGNGITGSALQS